MLVSRHDVMGRLLYHFPYPSAISQESYMLEGECGASEGRGSQFRPDGDGDQWVVVRDDREHGQA